MLAKQIKSIEVIYLRDKIELSQTSMLKKLLKLYPQIYKISKVRLIYYKPVLHPINWIVFNDRIFVVDLYENINDIILKRKLINFETERVE